MFLLLLNKIKRVENLNKCHWNELPRISNSARPLHEIIACDIFRVAMIIIVFLEAQKFEVQLGALFYNIPALFLNILQRKGNKKTVAPSHFL